MVEKNGRLTREEAYALIANLSEEEKRLLAGMLEEMKKSREAVKEAH